ncbi:MAG: efflux RND transporter periplasmic adaptor subunit [Candidatus Omnitrophica bacterium]|nr:efflux RND transporter periplasmic adaptor subunit [Candidatus Omnitrophota bacterium]
MEEEKTGSSEVKKALGWIKAFDPKKLISRIKAFDFKGLLKRIVTYDYKGLVNRIKTFEFKNPEAYKRLIKDKDFQKFVVCVVLFFILISFVKGCIETHKKEPIQGRPVEIGTVIQKDVPIYVESFATMAAIEDVDIQAQVTGKILEVHFIEGDEVKIGDPLFTIDPSEYKATLEKAQAGLEEDIADLKLKEDTLERNVVLIEKQLISQQEFEKYQTEVVAAVAQVELDKAQVDLARINLGYCYIISPIKGMTGKRLVDPGNIVTANTGPVLVNIKYSDSYYVDFTISERNLQRARDAMAKSTLKVEIRPEGADKPTCAGKLVFIDNTVDDMTGTVLLRGLVSNKDKKLWAGQFVFTKLILGEEKNAVLAPESSVRVGQKGPYLFAVTDKNKADLRLVETGQRQDDYMVIKKGVKPGERVVTIGQLGLAPGVPIIDVTKKGSGDASQSSDNDNN